MVAVIEASPTHLGRMGGEWSDLVASRPQRSVFLAWPWLDTWLDAWGRNHDVLVLLVRGDDGRLLGAAPLYVEQSPERHRLRWLMVVGQRNTYGEYLDVLARPGAEEKVAAAVAEHLLGPARRRWDVLYFERMLADAPMQAPLRAALEERGCRTRTVDTTPSPYLSLPEDPAELLAHVSRNFRQQVNQARNRVQRLGSVEVKLAGHDIDYEEAFDEMVRLHDLRWGERGVFGLDDVRRFYHRFGQRLLDRDELLLALLTVDGKAIAARFDFVYDDKIWCVQGGWDDDHRSARPGMALTRWVLEWGIEQGFREYDFLAGDHGYKARWASGQRQLVSFQAANPRTLRGRAYSVARLSPTTTAAVDRGRAVAGRLRSLSTRRVSSSEDAPPPADA